METVEELLAKSLIYIFLSRTYSSPPDSSLKREFLESLRKAFHILKLNQWDKEIEKMEDCLGSLGDPTELAVEYTRLFRGPVRAEAYPYESMYIDGEIMGESTLEIIKFYEKVGIVLSKDFKDLPDHITAQLEFMYYVLIKELQAREKGDLKQTQYLNLMRCSFLKDHLATWVPNFTERIMESASSPFYLSLAKLTKEFIHLEATSFPI